MVDNIKLLKIFISSEVKEPMGWEIKMISGFVVSPGIWQKHKCQSSREKNQTNHNIACQPIKKYPKKLLNIQGNEPLWAKSRSNNQLRLLGLQSSL